MKSTISSRFAPAFVMGALGVMMGSMALAQQVEPMPQVTVKAEREVTIKRDHRVGTSSRHMGQLYTASQRVDVSDLDLTASSDADALRTRIEGAAQNVCRQLNFLHPNGATDVPGYERTNENCVRDAVAGAYERVDAAMADQIDGVGAVE